MLTEYFLNIFRLDQPLYKLFVTEFRAKVIVAKQRHGSTGTVPLTFHKSTTKFADRAESEYYQAPQRD